jgi:nucleoside-diphosphate kinase
LSTVQRTLVLLKPDAVQRGLIGPIIARLEGAGLKIVAMKMLHLNQAMARQHYSAHEGKPFFNGLVQFITSSPLVAMVLEGEQAITTVRKLMGETDPAKAAPGTIRGDWALNIEHNLIHGSADEADAAREVALLFSPQEILAYNREMERWIAGK